MFRSLSWLAYIARRVCLSYAQLHSLLYSWPVRLRQTALPHSNQISFLPKSRQQTVHKFSPRKQKCREGEICEISPGASFGNFEHGHPRISRLESRTLSTT